MDDADANELRILKQKIESQEQDIAFLKSVIDRITEQMVQKALAVDIKGNEEREYEADKTYKSGVEFA